jgi:hypothetical protein
MNKKSTSSKIKIKVLSDDALINTEKKESVKEIGGPGGLEPTRFGDWEKNGRCSDF